MKVALSVPCYGRLKDLKRCIDSVESNKEIQSGDVQFFLVPDRHSDSDHLELEEFIDGKRAMILDRPPERIHACPNILRSLREMFEMGYDTVIRIDSDMVVSPYFVRIMIAAHLWSGSVVNCDPNCPITFQEKVERSGWINEFGFSSGTNMIISKDQWGVMADTILDYEKQFLRVPTFKIDTQKALDFSQKLAQNWNQDSPFIGIYKSRVGGTGADGILHCCLMAFGVHHASLPINRLIHVSTKGTHIYDELAERFSRTSLDVIPDDETRNEFQWK